MSEGVIEQAIGEITVRDATAAGVASASANFQRLYNVVRYNWWGIQNLGRAFQQTGMIIGAGLGAAVKATVEFDQGLAQVQRTGNLTNDELDQMATALRAMALRKPISLDDLTGIAAAAGQLGIQGVGNIESFTSVIADLVSTTNLTTQSAEQLAKLAGPLGITGDQWSRLGSTILALGINSAATETQIVNTATQLSGLGASAHATTPEIVAVATVIASLTNSVQSGATGFQRLVGQIDLAATGGTPALTAQFKEFAKIAGADTPKAIAAYKQSFQQDGIAATAQFIKGLGDLQSRGEDVTAVLHGLGIADQRQIRIMEQMAASTQQTANPTLNLVHAILEANNAWNRNTALAAQAQQMYATTANQIKILHNVVHDISISFGAELVGALNLVLAPIADLLYGIDSLPGPLKTVVSATAVFATGALLLGGALATMLPRIVLVLGSLKELAGVFKGATSEAKLTMAAVRAKALADEGAAAAAAVNMSSVTALSHAEREEAVAALQAANAAEVKRIADEGAAVAAKEHQAAEAFLAASQEQAAAAAVHAAEAEAIRMRASLNATEADDLHEAEIQALIVAETEQQAVAERAAAALETLALSHNAAAEAAARQTAMDIAHTEALLGMSVAEEEASGSSYVLGLALDAATGPFAIIFGLITAVTIGLGIMGAAHRHAAGAAQEQVAVDQQLFDIMRQGGRAQSDATKQYYLSNQAFLSAAAGADAYGISIRHLYDAITGLDTAQITQMLDNLRARYEAGDQAAGDEYNKILTLYNQHRATAIAANTQAESERKLGVNTKSAADASSNLTQTLQQEAAAHDKINQAILDYPDAVIGVQQANLQLTQAQKAYNDAVAIGNTKARDLADAEDKLTEAEINQRQAVESLREARLSLAHARQDEVNAVKDANAKLADDTDRLYDARNKVADAKLKLKEDQEGQSTLNLTKAINALHDAYAKLHDATNAVADAQYNLNYLLQEGASARDIADAQQQLTESQNAAADATTNVVDATDAVKEARRNSGAKQIAKDERDLAAAERDVASVQRQLKQDTIALREARHQLANNTLVKDREDALTEAEIKVREAHLAVRDATLALKDARRETGAESEKQAEVGLEQALLGVARAHVQVKKDLVEMHGGMFGAGKQAQAMGDQLDILGSKAGPVAGKIRAMAKVLHQAVKDINVAGLGDGPGTASAPRAGAKQAEPPAINYAPVGASASSGIIDSLKKHLRDIAIGLIAVVGGAIAILVGAIPTLIGLVVVAIVTGILLIINHRHAIAHAFEKVGGWIKDAFWSVIHWFQRVWSSIYDHIKNPIEHAAHWVSDHFENDVLPVLKAPWQWVKDRWGDITGFFTGPVHNAVQWIRQHFNSLVDWFTGLPDRIGNAASGMFGWVEDAMKSVINNIIGMWDSLWNWLGSKSFTLPKFNTHIPGIGTVGGETIGFSFLKNLVIPYLHADGGIATRAHMGVIGEAGPEAIMPLDRLFQMFTPIDTLAATMQANNEAMSALLSQQAAGGLGGGGDTFYIEGGEQDPLDIAREVVFQKKLRLK